jgi:fructokinase
MEPDHPGWDIEAEYLAVACANLALTCSPERIILGGGVMAQGHLFPRIRSRVQTLLNGYLRTARLLAQIDDYIVPPAWGQRAGVLGALCLAERAAQAHMPGRTAEGTTEG